MEEPVDELLAFDCGPTKIFLEKALDNITKAMKRVRKNPGWKKEDLQALKDARNTLHPYLLKLRLGHTGEREGLEVQELIIGFNKTLNLK